MAKTKGMTMVELMVVVVIIGVITTLALMTYSRYSLRARRADAINALSSISLAEERYRNSNSTYGTLAQVWGGVSTSPDGYYTLAISNVTASSYTITATAVGNQANDTSNGTACSSMVFAMSSGTITKTPSACWPS